MALGTIHLQPSGLILVYFVHLLAQYHYYKDMSSRCVMTFLVRHDIWDTIRKILALCCGFWLRAVQTALGYSKGGEEVVEMERVDG